MGDSSPMNTMWPSGRLDPRFGIVLDGAWAGLAAAMIAFLVYLAAQLVSDVYEAATATVSGLWLAVILFALAVPFAWLTALVPRMPLVVGGLGYGLLLYAFLWLMSGQGTARILVPLIVYGATLGLVLRYRRTPPTPDAEGGKPTAPP